MTGSSTSTPPSDPGAPLGGNTASEGSGSSGTSSSSATPLALQSPPKPYVAVGSVSSVFSSSLKPEDYLELSRNNWPEWSRQVRTLLALCPGHLGGYIDGRVSTPDRTLWPTEYAIFCANDDMVRAFCAARASGDDRRLIENAATARGMWSILTQRHEKQGPYAQALLLRELLGTRLDLSCPLPAQARTIVDKCERIVNMGPLTTSSLAVVALLHVLNYDLEHVANQIINNQSNTLSPLTVDRVIKRIELEQQQIAGRAQAATPSVALAAHAAPPRRSVPTCSNCKRTGHSREQCFSEGGPLFHRRDELVDKLRRNRDAQKANRRVLRDKTGRAYFLDGNTVVPLDSARAPSSEFAGVASDDHHGLLTDLSLSDDAPPGWLSTYLENSDDCALMASLEDYALVSQSSVGPFVFDSGATSHISPSRDDFTTMRTISPRGIRGVNGSLIYATGEGTITLPLSNSTTLTLDNVLFVPDAAVRLISIRSLVDSNSGFSVLFNDGGITLFDRSGSPVFSSAGNNRSLYTVRPHAPLENALVANRAPNIETIHRRLGHANYHTSWQVAKQLRATGTHVDLSEPPFKCEPCLLGKQTRTSVPKVRTGDRAKEVGGLLYIDGAGPQAAVSASGNLYSLDVIDDFSGMTWAFPTRTKAAMAPAFKRLVLTLEAKGHLVRAIQIDNGELVSSDVDSFCAERGISVRRTAPYTSAQNGRAERIHRTLMGRSRTMRIAANVPDNRWDELYVTAAYLHNRTPASGGGKTPFEVFHGHPPDISHLREIGCRAFVLIPTHNPKIHPRSLECVLIGYGTDSKTYRCYHRASHKVIASYHVRFIESHEDPTLARPPPQCEPETTPNDNDDLPPSTPAEAVEEATPVLNNHPPTATIPADNAAARHDAEDPPLLLQSVRTTPSPPASPPPARRSTRTRLPSERAAANAGVQYVDRVAQAVLESHETVERARAAREARRTALEDSLWSATDIALATVLQLDSAYTGDPTTMQEALASPFREQWLAALVDEFKSIKDMGVYTLVPRSDVPPGRKILRGKPVFRLKMNETNEPTRFKARWVCRGFEAVYGQDYHKTTSPTMRMESFRVLLHLAATLDWEIQQIDVKTAYLYGLLPDNETCYMVQPEGFEERGKESWVWQLNKGLYGMPQGGRTWNKTMHAHLSAKRMQCCPSEYCVYTRSDASGRVSTGVHVDDFLAICSSATASATFKADLRDEWTISDLGKARFCVGIAINQNRADRTVSLSQTALIDKVLEQFSLAAAAPVSVPLDPSKKLRRPTNPLEHDAAAHLPYRALVGSLNYIAVGTRPDISFAVQQLAQYLDCFTVDHWEAAKRVARYLKGTRDLCLVLGGTMPSVKLVGFADSDHASCPDTRRSVGGYCFSLGSGMISWAARKQATVSESSTEAEYIAAAEASKECVWLRSLLLFLGHEQPSVTPFYLDNTSTITLAGDPVFHARTKHIDIRHHILREHVSNDLLDPHYVNTKDNAADIFTKALSAGPFTKLRTYLGLR